MKTSLLPSSSPGCTPSLDFDRPTLPPVGVHFHPLFYESLSQWHGKAYAAVCRATILLAAAHPSRSMSSVDCRGTTAACKIQAYGPRYSRLHLPRPCICINWWKFHCLESTRSPFESMTLLRRPVNLSQ